MAQRLQLAHVLKPTNSDDRIKQNYGVSINEHITNRRRAQINGNINMDIFWKHVPSNLQNSGQQLQLAYYLNPKNSVDKIKQNYGVSIDEGITKR